MEYFEDGNWRPSGDGRCEDANCPCDHSSIPRGLGYLYISSDVVVFRREFRSYEAACKEMERRVREKFGRPVKFEVRAGPILLCVQAARNKGVDLEIASVDARYWWVTGSAPLRSTPMAGSRQAEEEKKKWM